MSDEHWSSGCDDASTPRDARPLVGPKLDRNGGRGGWSGAHRWALPGVGPIRRRGADPIRSTADRRLLPVVLVLSVVLAVAGTVFLVGRSSDRSDRPRLVVTSAALSSAGVASVGTAAAGVPFVVRLFGQASGRLTLSLDATCDQLPPVDLVVSTGSAGSVPRTTPACDAAGTEWDVAELTADVSATSFILGLAPAAARTGPAEWRGTMVLALRTDAPDPVAHQRVQLSLTGEGGVVVEDGAPLLPPSDAAAGGEPRPSASATQTQEPAGSPSGAGTSSTPAASSGAAGGSQRPTAGGSNEGGSTEGGTPGPAPTSEGPGPTSAPTTTSPETVVPDPGTPTAEPSPEEPPDAPVDPVVPVPVLDGG